MSQARTNPEVLDQPTSDVPRRTLSKLLLPERAIPKAEVPATAKHLSESLREFTDPLTAFVMLKQAEQIIKSALEQTQDHAQLKMEGKEMQVFGATVSLRALRDYEYPDPGYQELKRQMEDLKAKIADREKFMKLIKTPQADAVTGEIIEPAKLTRDGQTLSVKFN